MTAHDRLATIFITISNGILPPHEAREFNDRPDAGQRTSSSAAFTFSLTSTFDHRLPATSFEQPTTNTSGVRNKSCADSWGKRIATK